MLEIYFRTEKISEDTVVDILYRRDVFTGQVTLSSLVVTIHFITVDKLLTGLARWNLFFTSNTAA